MQEKKEIIRRYKAKTKKICFYYGPSLTHKVRWGEGGGGGASSKSDSVDCIFLRFLCAFLFALNTFQSCKSNNKGDIKQKHKIGYSMKTGVIK